SGLPKDSAEAAELGRAQQSMAELWSAAAAMSGLVAQAVPGQGDATIAATLNRLVDPRSWMSGVDEMGDVLGRMAEGPRLADLWDLERRYATVMQAWITVRRTGLEHNAVVLKAWVEAGRRFNEEISARGGDDAHKHDPKKPDAKKLDAQAAMALWTEIANRELLATQRSEDFLQTQTAMIRASTELRVVQQALVEHLGKQYGFPTRTELDDVHRTVTEMRRELRALRREQRRQAEPAPLPGAAAEPDQAKPVQDKPVQDKPGRRARRSAR
ncbi:MAG: hypothetical protein EOO66_19670, partial [Methylobacterium sp.]